MLHNPALVLHVALVSCVSADVTLSSDTANRACSGQVEESGSLLQSVSRSGIDRSIDTSDYPRESRSLLQRVDHIGVDQSIDAGEDPAESRSMLQRVFHTGGDQSIEASEDSFSIAGEEVARLIQFTSKSFDTVGLFPFWAIAVSSYIVSAVFTLGVWWWFGRRRESLVWSSGDSSDDESQSEMSASPTTTMHTQAVVASPTTTYKTTTYKPRIQKPPRLSLEQSQDNLKTLWKQETHQERLGSAALTIFILSCTMGVYAFVRLTHRPDCAPPVEMYVHGPEIMVLLALVGLAGCCWVWPRDYLYWSAIAIFLWYVPAVTLPPFNLSCTDLEVACRNSKHWRVSQAVNHVDCSMQGQTAQQIFLTGFLLLPWLFPDIKMFHIMWVWLFAVYLLWSIAYFRYSPDTEMSETPFSNLDIVIRLIFMACILAMSVTKKYYLQRSQLALFSSDLARREDSKKLYNILGYMLPAHVVWPMLMNQPIAESIDKATVMFVVIDDFDTIVREKSPEILLRFLNQQFTQFDAICKHYKVTKIETVGEEYVCSVGVTPAEVQACKLDPKEHAVVVGRLFKAASAILDLQTESVKFKMGAHTGPVVAGVIAQKLPRYRLFGDTINTAARMMQKGIVGKLQYGEETAKHLPEHVKGEPRGLIEMKGKGQVQTFLFSPSIKCSRSFLLVSRTDDEEDEEEEDDDGGGLLDALLSDDGDPEVQDATLTVASSLEVSNKEFTDVVARMAAAQTGKFKEVDTMPAKPKHSWFLSEQEGFTPEMEKAWRKAFHVKHVCNKIAHRLDVLFVALIVISTVEMLWSLPSPRKPYSGWARKHEQLGTWERLPIFLVCRAIALLVIVCVRLACRSGDWFAENPIQVQSGIVAAEWVLVITLYFSYDALIVGMDTKSTSRVLAPGDEIFSLIFVLLFSCLIREIRLFFLHMVAHIPLALFIAALSNLRHRSGVYFPVLGQVLFVVITISFVFLAHSEEQSGRAQYKAAHAIKTTKERVHAILETMMPPMVLEEIRNSPSGTRAHHTYEHATIAQSDLCGFTKLASQRPPIEVVKFIGELFGLFDSLTDKFNIYKVETVGDAYIAGQAEEPLTTVNSPTSVIEFGVAMISEVMKWSKRLGVEVRCRVGVHHGDVIGGIVDKEMQRYHMFGKMMQVIEILESTAPEGEIQISRACHDAVLHERSTLGLQTHPFELKERQGDHLTTSKGEIHQFSETGGQTFLVHLVQGPTHVP